jgi:oligo-1,6-glucosidase
MDVISVISKRNYDDSPYPNFNDTIQNIYANGPKIHEYLKEMNQEVMSHYDMMTVGEGPGISLENGLKYVQEDRKELNMVFHFDHMFIDHGSEGKFDILPHDFVHFKRIFADWDTKLKDKGWGSIFLGNHDFPRIVSRFGNDQEYWMQSAKQLATLLNSLRGTTYVYQGDEIGMTNVAFDDIHDYRDVEIFNALEELRSKNGDEDKFLKAVHVQGRDNARTPIQWNSEENAGFSKADPWIKVNPNYTKINVATQESNPDSVLNFYREIIRFRKNNLTMVYGDFEHLLPDHKELFVYKRWDEKETYLIIHNFSSQELAYDLDNQYQKMIGNYQGNLENKYQGSMVLKPWESMILKA